MNKSFFSFFLSFYILSFCSENKTSSAIAQSYPLFKDNLEIRKISYKEDIYRAKRLKNIKTGLRLVWGSIAITAFIKCCYDMKQAKGYGKKYTPPAKNKRNN